MTNTISPDVERLANDISARLAQVARNPPDLAAYLHLHAECVAKALAPRGFAYEMRSGEQYQRVIGRNLEDLDFRDSPEQEECFRRVVQQVSEENRAALLEPNSYPPGSEAMRGLKVEDAPAPDQLPLFNKTPFQHFFVPITLEGAVVGVLRVWFGNADMELREPRLALLQSVCRDIELYLKARRAAEVTEELTRLSTYTHLLEELAGDLDLETTSWNLVNYAREAVVCDRVSIFTVRDYARDRWRMGGAVSEMEFEIQACSGLKRPHPRSEHAEVLKALAGRLLEHTMGEKEADHDLPDEPAEEKEATGEEEKALEPPVPDGDETLEEDRDPEGDEEGEEKAGEAGDQADGGRLLTVPFRGSAADPYRPGAARSLQGGIASPRDQSLFRDDSHELGYRPSLVRPGEAAVRRPSLRGQRGDEATGRFDLPDEGPLGGRRTGPGDGALLAAEPYVARRQSDSGIEGASTRHPG